MEVYGAQALMLKQSILTRQKLVKFQGAPPYNHIITKMNDNQENTENVSETVKSLLDIENSTCCIDSYKGRPTFAINKSSKYPFSFGLAKAALIVKYYEALKNFVDSKGQQLTK